eukprot:g1417.t1
MTEFPRRELDLVIHLGRQVSMLGAFDPGVFDDIARRFMNAETRSAEAVNEGSAGGKGSGGGSEDDTVGLTEQDWFAAEAEILERLRDRYRIAWNLPHVQPLLARRSNLMLCTEQDVYEGLSGGAREQLSRHPLGATVLRRCARQVWQEYQRQLWDPRCIKRDVAADQDETFFVRQGDVGILFADMKSSRLTPDGSRRDLQMLSFEQIKTWQNAFNEPGLLTLVVVAELPFVWYSDDDLDDRAKQEAQEAQEAQPAEQQPNVKTTPNTLPARKHPSHDHWAYHHKLLGELLANFFDWKNDDVVSGRQVLLLCGGTHVGAETTIRDNATGLEIQQVTVGPSTDSPMLFDAALEGLVVNRPENDDEPHDEHVHDWTTGRQFSYTHVPFVSARNYARVAINLDPRSAELKAALKGPMDDLYAAPPPAAAPDAAAALSLCRDPHRDTQRPRCVLGPVIGKVTSVGAAPMEKKPRLASADAAVLFEVDRAAQVTCVAIDALSGNETRKTVQMEAFRPHRFWLQGLNPSRRYVVRLDGVANAAERVGYFSTPDPLPSPGVREVIANAKSSEGKKFRDSAEGRALLAESTDMGTGTAGAAAAVDDGDGSGDEEDGPKNVTRTNFVVVYGDRAEGLPRAPVKAEGDEQAVDGEEKGKEGDESQNPWVCIRERLQHPCHGIDACLHVGGQVYLTEAFRECMGWARADGSVRVLCLQRVKEHQQRSVERTRRRLEHPDSDDEDDAGPEKTWEESAADPTVVALLRRIEARFRAEYRRQWNQPHVREVLARCAHVMMWSDQDVCEGFNRISGGVPGGPGWGRGAVAATAADEEDDEDDLVGAASAAAERLGFSKAGAPGATPTAGAPAAKPTRRKSRKSLVAPEDVDGEAVAAAAAAAMGEGARRSSTQMGGAQGTVAGRLRRQSAFARAAWKRAFKKATPILNFREMKTAVDATVEVEAGRACLRAARTVFREYQRSLWDAQWVQGREERARGQTRLQSERAYAAQLLKRTREEQHELREAEAAEAAKEAETAASELRLGTRAPSFYGQKAPTWMVAASDAVDEEWMFHKWGDVGVLFLDLRADVYKGGVAPRLGELRQLDEGERPNLPEAQWQFLVNCLASGVQQLVVVSEVPFLWEEREKVKRMERRLDRRGGDVESNTMGYLYDQWVYRPTMLSKMLDRMYEWRDEVEGREVLMLCGCGAMGRGFETVVTDGRRNLDMQQLAVGPVTSALKEFAPARSLAYKRWQVEHTVCRQHNYGLVEVELHTERDMYTESDEEGPAKGKAAAARRKKKKKEAGEGGGKDDVEQGEGKNGDEGEEGKDPDANEGEGKGEDEDEDEDMPTRVLVETKHAAVTAQLVTPFDAAERHAPARLGRRPAWFEKWSPGEAHYWWEDDLILAAEEDINMRQLKRFLRTDGDFEKLAVHYFNQFQFQRLVDARLDEEHVHRQATARLRRTAQKMWDKLYDKRMAWEVAPGDGGTCYPLRSVGYVPDPFVFERVLARMDPNFAHEWAAQHFVELMQDMFEQAGYMRMAGLLQLRLEGALAFALEAEEQKRLEIAKHYVDKEESKRRAEEELKRLEEEARADPEGEAMEAFRKAEKEAKKKAEKAAKKKAKKEAEEAKKAKEAKRQQAREWRAKKEAEEAARQAETDELNELATTDPAEYDRRTAEKLERDKLEFKEREAKAARRKRIREAKEKKAREDARRAEQEEAEAEPRPLFMMF